MAAHPKILIVCGEPSGDLHASLLCRALLAEDPSLSIRAVGGPLLKAAGAQIIRGIEELSVMGVFDVLKKLPLFFSLQDAILKEIEERPPSCLILVDFSGFNLRLAKKIDRRIPVFYYVSPQVWASRARRVERIRKYVSRMIVLFDFEKEFYSRHGISADFVGHPLVETARPAQEKPAFFARLGLSPSRNTVTLLPGSRPSEIARILPVMAEACTLLKKSNPGVQFLLCRPPHLPEHLYSGILQRYGIHAAIAENAVYDCLAHADAGMICSGTATLEAALIGTPFVLVYRTSTLNYLLYKPQVKIPWIGMANIVAGEKVVEEFIQGRAQPRDIARAVGALLNDIPARTRMQEAFGRIRKKLGPPGATGRAAKIILEAISAE
jgi:lipid-A-disaccharide synthase